MELSLSQLELVLEAFGSPVAQWGKGEARSVQSLLDEILEGESHLQIDGFGLSRVVSIVKMFITSDHFPHKILLEWGQVLPDGRSRERRQNPSGKIGRGERPEKAAQREAEEELGIVAADLFQVVALHMVEESRPSKSHPSLACRYRIYPFELHLGDDAKVCQEETFERVEVNGTRHIFKWVDQ
ncbi:NUDIX domain-containing protein [Candidatus Parcubacteria bacterium]|nr:NUDIX domain-containing protein [Candidatus Parcubacteria bacterium]